MSDDIPQNIQEPWWSRYKWLLPVLLALAIILIVVGFVLAKKMQTAKPKPTPTPTVRPTPTPKPTATVRPTRPPTPTPTRVHGTGKTPVPTATHVRRPPTPTPTPRPTKKPRPTATPTPSVTPIPTVQGLSLGYIKRSPTRIHDLQVAATNGQKGFKFYLTPILVIHNTLQSYGFTGSFKIVQPRVSFTGTPTTTPKPYTTRGGIPAVSVVVQYQGHTYKVVLEQLSSTRGQGGIWLISQVGPRLS